VPPISCERNAVPSERSLRPRCNLKQPSKLRDYVCSCNIRWWWQTCSFFVYVGKMLFFDCASKITYHVYFTFLYCKSV